MRGWIGLGALGMLACGARSALPAPEPAPTMFDARPLDADRVADAARPDAGSDAGVKAPIDAFVPTDECAPRSVLLEPIRPEVLFLLDRSASMGWALSGPGGIGPSRWAILVDALFAELPRFDASSEIGLLLFPDGDGGSSLSSTSREPRLAPGPDQSAAILSEVAASGPGGGRTPTASALEAARRWFRAHPEASRVRAVVLATDGAPNCNSSLDGRSCPCTDGPALLVGGACPSEPLLCLDDRRSLEAIADLSSEGIPTYVIGIDGAPGPALAEVLRRLALAGGRPNPLDPDRAFYAVTSGGDLAAAFERIQGSIESCSLAPTTAVAPEREVALTLDGELVPRDPRREQGWEWSASGAPIVVLHGAPCERAQIGDHRLELTLTCPP